MTVRQAKKEEGAAVVAFYTELIEKIQTCKYHATWTMGVYPTAELLLDAVEDGEMFLALDGNRIVGAMRMTSHADDLYASVPWTIDAGENGFYIIHLLCVLPDMFGKDVGNTLIDFAKQYAGENGKKVLRLDVLTDNLSAIRLYERTGFRAIKTLRLFYESTGWTDFAMYEYVL